MKKKERYGAFLLYADDWLSSTSIDLMTAAQERGYLRLLLHCWKADDCGIPDEPRVLAQLSKLGPAWGKSGEVVRARFESRDGRLYNVRLLEEREYQINYRENKRKASVAGNAARWGSRAEQSVIPDGTDVGSQGDPNPNPNPNPRTNLKSKPKISLSQEWEVFKELYPSHRIDEDSALTEWNNRDEPDAIIEGVKLHLKCEEWKRDSGRYIPRASKFLRDGLYKTDPRSPAEQMVSKCQNTTDPETARRMAERRARQ